MRVRTNKPMPKADDQSAFCPGIYAHAHIHGRSFHHHLTVWIPDDKFSGQSPPNGEGTHPEDALGSQGVWDASFCWPLACCASSAQCVPSHEWPCCRCVVCEDEPARVTHHDIDTSYGFASSHSYLGIVQYFCQDSSNPRLTL